MVAVKRILALLIVVVVLANLIAIVWMSFSKLPFPVFHLQKTVAVEKTPREFLEQELTPVLADTFVVDERNPQDIRVITKTGLIIKIGPPLQLPEKIKVIKTLLSVLDNKSTIAYIDARAYRTPAVKFLKK
jgi:hypothetical protein